MPVTVDLPLVPPTAIGIVASLNRSASISARVRRAQPRRSAATMSGTVGSIAAEAIDDLVGRSDPAAVLREQLDAQIAEILELGGQPRLVEAAVRPRDASRPCAARIIASGIIPDPPMPTKKAGCVGNVG